MIGINVYFLQTIIILGCTIFASTNIQNKPQKKDVDTKRKNISHSKKLSNEVALEILFYLNLNGFKFKF